jgi:hypothetical protein
LCVDKRAIPPVANFFVAFFFIGETTVARRDVVLLDAVGFALADDFAVLRLP